jgi:putative acetyltransferase
MRRVQDAGSKGAAAAVGAETIAAEPLGSEAVQGLIAALNAELTAQYANPADNFFSLAAEEVAPGRGVFLVARAGDHPVGCGAIRCLDVDAVTTAGQVDAIRRAEIKRMYVVPEARGRRLATRVLAALEVEARRLGVEQLVLETGDLQVEAIALYVREGFARIPAFGEYVGAPRSICYGKMLG